MENLQYYNVKGVGVSAINYCNPGDKLSMCRITGYAWFKTDDY